MAAKNPWLDIPAADYEGHMGEGGVAQSGALRMTFKQVYDELRPRRVAVLGCGAGGGLDVVDPEGTERLVGVDLNPEYIALARQRHPRLGAVAEWICAPVQECAWEAATFDLVHAALLFEYLEPSELPQLLGRIARWLTEKGVVSVVLQLPGGDEQISPTRFPSLQLLSGLMRLVPPDELCELAARHGLMLRSSTRISLARGKSFWSGTFAPAGMG